MKRPSDPGLEDFEEQRMRVLGLGEHSARKSYYPELRARISELERFRAALDGSNDAILLVALPGGTLDDVNETTCRMLQRARGEPIGQRLGDLQPALGVALGHAAELSNGQRETVEATLRPTGGGAVPVEVTLNLVQICGERYAIAVARDISERKQAELERELLLERERVARAEAEHASRIKDDFVATISHELRTPLNAIQGWMQLVAMPGTTPERLAKGLAVVSRNTRLMTLLVADLLDTSRITSGKLSLDRVPLDLSSIVEETMEELRAVAATKGIELHLDKATGVAPMLGDPVRLQQVVSNLVSNALNFTPRTGRIDVTLTHSADRVILVVRDTGQGIEPEFLPYVFDRFRQADASAARRHGGLGLGLTIVKNVVDLHGGTVRAESAGLGRGACFTVELPAAGARATSAAARKDLANLTGVRALVVEDEPDASDLVQRILEEQGAEVRTVPSALDALQTLAERSIDVIVSDIGLPGMDGYELMRQIRAGRVPGASNTPAVAQTPFARPEDHAQALNAGFQAHVAKPIDCSAFVAEVAGLVFRDVVS